MKEKIMVNTSCFWYGHKHKEESKRKIGLANSIAQAGERNSHFGTCWVSNIEKKECKSIKKEELNKYIKQGWIKKRIINWDAYINIDNKMVYKTNARKESYYRNVAKMKETKALYEYLYPIYKGLGFADMKLQTGYPYSDTNFYNRCKHWIPGFITNKEEKLLKEGNK